MNKKGFTLVELLITIVIVGVIATIASYGAVGVSNLTKNNLVQAKKQLILSGAEAYGEDHQYSLTNTCLVDNETVNNCVGVTVADLIDAGYITTTETCEGIPCLKHNLTGYDMSPDEVVIYKKNNRIYASYIDSED